jgi:hypothetical protein
VMRSGRPLRSRAGLRAGPTGRARLPAPDTPLAGTPGTRSGPSCWAGPSGPRSTPPAGSPSARPPSTGGLESAASRVWRSCSTSTIAPTGRSRRVKAKVRRPSAKIVARSRPVARDPGPAHRQLTAGFAVARE